MATQKDIASVRAESAASNSANPVSHVTVHGPLAREGRTYRTVATARRAVDRLDATYGAITHSYSITYLTA